MAPTIAASARAPARPSATGGPLSGTVRFRIDHQVRMSVDAWGPGLLVLAGRPGSPKSPHGGGFALITTCGASDEGVARLGEAWGAVWRGALARVSAMP